MCLKRPFYWMVMAGLVACVMPSSVEAAPCAGADIQGTVFHDYNADGAMSAGNVEVGLGGAVVTAFSDDGSATSCESLGDGTFGIDAPSGGLPVRVEVTLPPGSVFDELEPGAAGATRVFFVAAAGSGFDVGFNAPLDYCQDNPDLLTARVLQGDPLVPGSDSADGDALISLDYDRTSGTTTLSSGSAVGAVWGLAYHQSSDSLFAASVLRRHTGLGPLGIGGIYQVDLSAGSAGNFVDLSTLGAAVGTDPRSEPGEDPPGNGPTGNEPGLDNRAYEQIGKVGLGDIDMDELSDTLWVMSLGDRRLYALDVGPDGTAPSTATPYDLPSVSCTDGEFRPWAVKTYRGRVYIGGVCSNELISPYPTPGGFIDFPNLTGHVYSMDPADGVFTLELTIPLNYAKGCAGGAAGCQWYPWTDLSTAALVSTPSLPAHPSPILSDIEFLDDGDMLIGFNDRTGLQYGTASPSPNGLPTDTTVITAFSGGEMLRAGFDPVSGTFTLESNGVVDGISGAGAGNLQGPGGGEYFSASTAGFHFELSLGAFAVLRGSNQFVGSAMDPVTINSGGLLWMHDQGATPGAFFAGYTLYDITTPSGFRKGSGVGDVELRCDPPPIEIGNRVWCDAAVAGEIGDGIQGPSESPLGGVVVDLSCDGGALTASTTTQSDGTYLFNAANVAGGLPAGASCTVSIDTSQGALGDCNLPTEADAGGMDPGGDLRDSDGTDADQDGTVEVTLSLGGPGANDHSFDFGFMVAPTIGTVGDTVWCDGLEGFGNGVFDAGEGLAGVTVRLFADSDCDGTSDGAALGVQKTAGDGQYGFVDLLVGTAAPVCYVVQVDAKDASLGACALPLTPTESGAQLSLAVPEDLDNDFGFVEPCEDSDGDGICNESCVDDRDGDGVPDCSEFDPQGYFYCEDNGEILSGGSFQVTGPGAVTVIEDGSTGRYAWVTDGTPGVYIMTVEAPGSFPMSSLCLDQGALDPTGSGNPLALGAGEDGATGFLTSFSCDDNPFYLAFDLEAGDPLIINNNIPMASCAQPPIEIPTHSPWGLALLVALLGTAGVLALYGRR